MDNSVGEYLADFRIPVAVAVDLFVSKKQKNGGDGGDLRFVDASGNLVFRVDRQSLPLHNRLIVDPSGNPLISIRRNHKGPWQGFRGDDSRGKDLIFRVERTLNTLSRTEFDVFLVDENFKDSKSDFKMKGCPFHRSCTVYKGNSILAQTSLMYKLGFRNVYVPRNRFRVTIFPGSVDHAMIVALIAIFFDGRKIWI